MGAGLARKKPCPYSTLSNFRVVSSFSVSIPSAMRPQPTLSANRVMPATMAWRAGSVSTLRTREMSSFTY